MCSSPRARGLAGVAHAPARRPRLRDVLSEAPPAEPVAIAVPRPVDEEGLALDLLPLHESPVPAVMRPDGSGKAWATSGRLSRASRSAMTIASPYSRLSELRGGLGTVPVAV